MKLKTVTFQWSMEHGECYDCGLPAAFVLASWAGPDGIPESAKRCAVCAANEAALGQPIIRIDRE